MPDRRTVLFGAATAITVAAGAAVGLIQLAEAGVIPGKGVVDEDLGYCDASVPPVAAAPGEIVAGAFDSAARGTRVGFRIAYPPGHRPGARLPVCLVLHGYGATEVDALGAGDYPAYLASVVAGGVPAYALASVAGGNGYWHPQPGDDPLGMLLDEFLPLLGTRGLDVARPAVLGYSMGAFGALLCGLTRPGLFVRIEASTPAFWRSYAEARRIDPGAFASAGDWSRYGDLISQAPRIDRLPAGIYVGASDPFEPAVRELRKHLADPGMVRISTGCHDGRFWRHNAPGQLTAIGTALAA